ncbi:gamma-mobile-trio recombinase GmtY [Vibrio salinus]|uniref:gamma-mobile-trio recombinase GmtY n=1 Tax=Vibrio salinus TaxID=2899784 RepID=UPI001E56DBD0|nr:gamma-mobile-trio recombinase GmtY [Vibrio salinus]MCE0493876.1 site-specific integrase [Vibrio salinus]
MGYVIKRSTIYKANGSPLTFQFPTIFTENGILLSHLRFLYTKRNKSQSWLERNTFAIELLLKFINAQIQSYLSATNLLRAFVDALQFGTIQHGKDNSGLYWSPRKNEDVHVLLGHINSYCDYLDSIHGYDLPKLNPLRKTTFSEERLQWCAYYRRNSRCFLNHLNTPSPTEMSFIRSIHGPNRHLVNIESVYRFPEEDIDRLLNDGFRNSSGKFDIGSQLITMLMHYGGLRLSECFHIYTSDIYIDPKTGAALISVFHPSDGTPPDKKFRTRREFLEIKHHMKPRNEYLRHNRLYSGWKNPLLTNRNLSFEVMFFPPHKAIEFTQILQLYLSVRPKSSTPFLFVNSKGTPESKKNFIRKHSQAVRRIGLPVSKQIGTTPHGHRHSYGYRLSKNGVHQLDIQKAMHHKSPDSCLVYLQPTNYEVQQIIREKMHEE